MGAMGDSGIEGVRLEDFNRETHELHEWETRSGGLPIQGNSSQIVVNRGKSCQKKRMFFSSISLNAVAMGEVQGTAVFLTLGFVSAQLQGLSNRRSQPAATKSALPITTSFLSVPQPSAELAGPGGGSATCDHGLQAQAGRVG